MKNLFYLICLTQISFHGLYGQTRYDDSLALVDFYHSTNGPNWTTTWDLNQPMDTWHRVTLQNGRVIRLNPTNNNLTGTIPDLNLTNVGALILNNNQLTGTIPDFTKMPVLEELYLTFNQLSGDIPDFQHLPILFMMVLNNNQLSGPLPNFQNTPNLTFLHVNNNQLTDTIPDLVHLPVLQFLHLDNNNFTDTIPDFTSLPLLFELYLHDNQLVGNIPNFSNLPKVISLFVHNNQLTGQVPFFSMLPSLRNLLIENNQFTFEDLIEFNQSNENLCLSNNGLYRYQPQDYLTQKETITIPVNSDYLLNLVADDTVSSSTYNWYKDGQPFTTTLVNNLSFQDFQPNDVGVYHCEVSNPYAPKLTLSSKAKTIVLMDGCEVVCVGYSSLYSELYSATFPGNVSTISWEVIPGGSTQILSGQGTSTVELDFSNPNPASSEITLLAAFTTVTGTDTLAYQIQLDTACVWPGDVNNDGQLNTSSEIRYIEEELALEMARMQFLDFLDQPNETLHNAFRDPGCLADSIHSWVPQSSTDWKMETANGNFKHALFEIKDESGLGNSKFLNLKYADCNGNGTLDLNQHWNQMLNTPFSNVSNPTDHDIIAYQTIMGNSHLDNQGIQLKQNKYNESLRIVAPDTIYIGDPGDQVVFFVYLGSTADTIRDVHHIAFVGVGEYGDYYRPAVTVDNSHLTNGSTIKSVGYTFRHADFNGIDNDSLSCYSSIGRPENLSYSIDFSGEEVCRLVCHITVAGLYKNKKHSFKGSNGFFPLTFNIPAAGLLLENGLVEYVQSNTDTIWVQAPSILNAKVLLEGPYKQSTNLMKDDLRIGGLVPTQEPYKNFMFNYPIPTMKGLRMADSSKILTATGSNAIVDWVFIEVRNPVSPYHLIASRAALLACNGQIVDIDGKSPVRLIEVPYGDYHITIKHRTHLPVMTQFPVRLDHNSTLLDFTDGSNATLQKKIASGVYCCYAGDTNHDYIIDATDRSSLWNDRNQFGYLRSDINLDGIVSAEDRSMNWNNRNVSVVNVP